MMPAPLVAFPYEDPDEMDWYAVKLPYAARVL
jgi:hypothetical protein